MDVAPASLDRLSPGMDFPAREANKLSFQRNRENGPQTPPASPVSLVSISSPSLPPPLLQTEACSYGASDTQHRGRRKRLKLGARATHRELCARQGCGGCCRTNPPERVGREKAWFDQSACKVGGASRAAARAKWKEARRRPWERSVVAVGTEEVRERRGIVYCSSEREREKNERRERDLIWNRCCCCIIYVIFQREKIKRERAV